MAKPFVLAVIVLGMVSTGPRVLSAPLSAPPPPDEMIFHQDVAWSSDGKDLTTSAMKLSRTAWAGDRAGALKNAQYDIVRLPLDGSPPTRVTDSPENEVWATWWPGSHCLLYAATSGTAANVCFINSDGTGRNEAGGALRQVRQPSVSRDGKRVAFMSGNADASHIYVLRNDGSDAPPVKLSTAGPHNDNPVLSPDAQRVVFYSDRFGAGHDQILVANADGTGETRLTNDQFNNIFPAWSPDGSRVVFASDREKVSAIFSMNADGSDIRRLSPPGMRAFFARWSPDGRRLAFVAGTFPDSQVYVADADGSNAKQLTR